MRFQVIINRDRFKCLQQTISTLLCIMKEQKNHNYPVIMIYIASQKQIRLLIQIQVSPIILVIQKQAFNRIISSSSHSKNNQTKEVNEDQNDCSMGFEFQDGIKFFEELLLTLKLENEDLTPDQAKVIKMKLCRQKQFRYLELRGAGKVAKLEVQKPTKDQQQLFSYEWIDGVRTNKIVISANCFHILQILKFASKYTSSTYFFETAQEKVLELTINLETRRIHLGLKSENSFIQASGIITNTQGDFQGDEQYTYDIRIEDTEILSMIFKKQSSFIIDEQGNLITYFTDDLSNCQILLKKWVNLSRNPEREKDLKFEG